jgi:hypothetical protein
MRWIRCLAAVALVGVTAACSELLDVSNPNNPDRPRVLGNPGDIEGVAGAQFQSIMSATLGSTQRVQTGMLTAAFENSSALANNGLGPRSFLPRQPIDNARGNAYEADNFATYRILSFTARTTADVLARINDPEFNLGAGRGPGDLNRLKAWTHFMSALAHGYLALTYDQAAIARPSDAPREVPPLVSYQEVFAYALAEFDSALAYAAAPGTTAIAAEWLTGPGGGTVEVADFVRVVRSYRARLRAGLARTPADRLAVDWDQVIADAEAGIQANFTVRMDPSRGWDYQWLALTLHFRDANWHQMPYNIIGMADVSGAFDNWIAAPRNTRASFTIVTPDLRFPRGSTRAAQNRPSADDNKPLPEGQYFRNRQPGKDQSATGWQNSHYDHYRWRAFSDASRIGAFPIFTRAENDMLAAEGYIRKGNFAAAAALIDRTRTKAELPPTLGMASATEPVPGGAACVPRVPVGPNFTSTACGTILEAMKWEKRLETAYTTFGAWFFDSRGWGDLPVGTAIHWPVPVNELNARGLPAYNLGGEGREGAAGPSTYGYGIGER